MTFKRYSETNPDALKELKPDLGLRSWNYLTKEDKVKIWIYLDEYFFNKNIVEEYKNEYFVFKGDRFQIESKKIRIRSSIYHINQKYKVKSFGRRYLEESSELNACYDFYDIFINQNEEVVYELISLYCEVILIQSVEYFSQNYFGVKDENYEMLLKKSKWDSFDNFAKVVNETFSQFGINVVLTRVGFIPKQEEKITEEIYRPVLNFFSDSKWKSVNQELSDAFSDYRLNTPDGFSGCITKTSSAIQAFLQMIVKGETGKGEILELISIAQKQNLIPTDLFSTKALKEIVSVLMKERQETGDAHPKKEYATEKNARLILNLSMIFFQHCIQN